MWHYLFGILLFSTALFLILLILVQRGRGGGLTGALGGMGGQSAFGTKAGDVFTRITMGVAAFWILLCIAAISLLNRPASMFGAGPSTPTLESAPGAAKDEDLQPGVEKKGATGGGGLTAPAEDAEPAATPQPGDAQPGDAQPPATDE